jgi:rhodanese-related sulfurtransferase
MPAPTIAMLRPEMTMAEILRDYPSAQRALFQRYHIGGCSSCGFQPTDTLAQVCRDHNLLDVGEVMRHVQLSHEADQRLQVDPREVRAWLDAKTAFRFIDVRPPQEIALARIAEAEPLDFGTPQQYMALPKETRIVFTCKTGVRSLDVAAYFAGHGFGQAFSMRGGLDRWRAEVDPSVPSY